MDNEPDNDDLARLRVCVERLLHSPTFKRSPVQSRLLAYLLEMTEANAFIKSYTIAVEGLGKDDSSGGDPETYARVSVARLRKTLATYFAEHPDPDAFHIDAGTYHLRLTSAPDASKPDNDTEIMAGGAEADSVSPLLVPESSLKPPLAQSVRKPIWLIAAAVLLCLAAYAVWSTDQESSSWKHYNLPTLSVRIAQTDSSTDSTAIEEHYQSLLEALGSYPGIRLVDKARPDYQLEMRPGSDDGIHSESLSLVEVSSSRVIWSETYDTELPDSGQSTAHAAAFSIASPSGALVSHLRQRGYDPNTPLGCWLRFTESIQTYNSIDDDILSDCAKSWYEAAPDRAVAALLYGWTLTDASVLEFNAKDRAEHLEQAIEVLDEAAILNPEIAIIHVAQMRLHSFKGEREQTIRSARQAIESGEGNRLVLGMAAAGLAMWNEPDGERILLELQHSDSPAMPWEEVGLLVAAMMRNDVEVADRQISRLEPFTSSQPLLLLLKAAVAARIGRKAEAEAALASLQSGLRGFIFGPDEIIARLPMAPEVKNRIREWIATGRNP